MSSYEASHSIRTSANPVASTISTPVSDAFLQLPWHNLNARNGNFLFKFQVQAATYRLMITDFVRTYYEEIKDDQLRQRSANLNTRFDLDMYGVVNQLEAISKRWIDQKYEENEELVIVKQDDHACLLKSISILSTLLFHWEFQLVILEPNAIFRHVIQPLLGVAMAHKTCASQITSEVEKMDKESDQKNNIPALKVPIISSTFVETFFKRMFETESAGHNSPVIDLFRGPLYDTVITAINVPIENKPDCSNIKSEGFNDTKKTDLTPEDLSFSATYFNKDKKEIQDTNEGLESLHQRHQSSTPPPVKKKKKKFNF